MHERIEKRAYLYLAPTFLVLILFTFLPFSRSLYNSFFSISASGERSFVFLQNYKRLLENKYFLLSLENTLIFILLFLPLNGILTLLSASLVRRKTKFNEILSSIYMIPLSFSLSFTSIIFRQIFNGRNSIANTILPLDINYLNTKASAFFVLLLLSVFLDFALDHILLLSSFRKIDKSILEAAKLDGAGSCRLYFQIELPEVLPTFFLTLFLAFKDALLISAPILTLTEGGPFRSTETVMYYYYLEAFKSGNRAEGAAISTLMVLTSSMIIFLYYLVMRRRDHE